MRGSHYDKPLFNRQHGREALDIREKEQPMSKTRQGHKPLDPHVILTVRAGVVDIVLKPRGVTVALYDYDIEGAGEGDAGVSKDPSGRLCSIRQWDPSEEIVTNDRWPMICNAIHKSRPYSRKWKCPECGLSVDHPYEALADVGGPVCRDCDIDMEMI